jgi:hypothetical protein
MIIIFTVILPPPPANNYNTVITVVCSAKIIDGNHDFNCTSIIIVLRASRQDNTLFRVFGVKIVRLQEHPLR